ncbi:hypothetical protein ARAM_003933 [Aspergillus rambellii]|uniref:Zn(2)-C6 fungal-type domain-containing protein n=1 Tax=Aspergillus rambellii TaxID=308745 RepID=A0A0F8X1Z7_9EURO|nr:hypothetical protein ARAM_003933 [Aspergillus rambellii]
MREHRLICPNSCQSCIRLGLSCEGYGSIWAKPLGPAAQVFKQTEAPKRHRSSLSPTLSVSSLPSSLGQAFSTHRCVLSPPSSEQSFVSQSSPLPDRDDPDKVDGYVRDLVPCDQLVVGSPSPSRIISHLSDLDTHYLQYHMERGSKLLANLEIDENPLRSLIIPRALSSPLIMKALCAVSAIHFSNRAHYSWCAENEGANYYIDTMRTLRSTLAKAPGGSFPDDAILTVALLCKYEIVRGSVQQWAVHLDALERLVISRGGFDNLDQETAEFIRGLFVYVNNVARITNRRKIGNSIPSVESLGTRKLDIYIGYTEEILKLCARIADLPLLSSDFVALGLEINTIDTLLRNWTTTETKHTIPKGMTAATISRLHMVADCFRDAAYIYLHSILARITQDIIIIIIEPPSPSTRPPWNNLISLPKAAAVQRLLQRIRTCSIDDNCEYSALTFPLFIAGCESETQSDRSLIFQVLTTLEVNFGIRNVQRVKELLGILWRGGKSHWLDVLEELQWDLILA